MTNAQTNPFDSPAAQPSPSYLSSAEIRLIEAVADTFFPSDGPIPRSGSRAGIVGWFERHFAMSPPSQLRLMRLLLRFTQLSPLLFGPRHARFTRLRPHERFAFLATMADSRIYFRRVALLSLRTLMTMAYLSDPEVMATIGIALDTDPFGLGEAPPFESVPPPTPAVSGVRLKGEADPSLDDVG